MLDEQLLEQIMFGAYGIGIFVLCVICVTVYRGWKDHKHVKLIEATLSEEDWRKQFADAVTGNLQKVAKIAGINWDEMKEQLLTSSYDMYLAKRGVTREEVNDKRI